MRKFMHALLCLAMVLSILSTGIIPASATQDVTTETEHEHVYEYDCDAVCSICKDVRDVNHEIDSSRCSVCGTIVGNCGDDIIYFIQDEVLVLSGTGEMYHYDFWYNTVPWELEQSHIKKIVVSEGITSLGTNAFCDCINVTEVQLPSTLKKMWMNALAVCESLPEITIPKDLEEIDVSAFANCTSMLEYKVAEGNTHFSSQDGVLFNSDKTSLWAYPIGLASEIYEMPNTVQRVEAYAFSEATNLKDIIFSENLKHIDDEAFHNCINLTEITLPDGFSSTGGGAFQGCENLSLIHLPDTITRIGPLCFDQTAYYNNLDNWEHDLVLYLDNYLLQAREEWDEVAGESGLELGGEYNVKSGTTLIADEAFDFLWDLTNVTLPNSLKYIGEGAFCSCKGLTEIVIPDSVTHIGEIAFYLSANLERVYLPDGLQRIGYSAFDDTAYLASIANAQNPIGYDKSYVIGTHSSLTEANIKDGTVLIAENAFEAAGSSVKSITLPESLRYIGAEAFISTSNVKNIEVPNTVEFIGDSAFGFYKYYDRNSESYVYTHINDFVLSGYTDSAADAYAKKFNVPFNYLDGCNHEYNSSITTAYTCTTPGEMTYQCKFCTHFYTEPIQAQHTDIVIDPAIEPGCNTNGMTEGKHCEACGTTIVEQFTTGSLNHRIGFEFGQEPTCNKTGVSEAIWCEDCQKYIKEPEIIPATGNHRELSLEEIPASCIEEGRTGGTFCSLCGETVKSPSVLPINDNHKNIVVDMSFPPTCTTDGKTDGSHCEDCGDIIIPQQTIPSSGHNYTSSTCEAAQACTICGETTGNILSHNYDSGIVTTKATLNDTGIMTYTCTNCGETETEVINCPESFKLSSTAFTYNGKVRTPTVTVNDSTNKPLIENIDYTITYAKGRKNVGTYKVTINMIGMYTGTKTLSFKINPKATKISSLKSGKKALTVKYSKQTSGSGYEIQYSTSKKFKNAKIANIAKNKTVSKTVKKLKAKTIYYVRVRTYKTIGKTKYYSNWCSYKQVKTK